MSERSASDTALDGAHSAELASSPSAGLREFEARRGRPLRVLHVGNIANNAYLNARFLREAGVDCDVVCHDYYHIMACPEWEEVDFNESLGDQFRPDWTRADLGAYRRPPWFVQGPADLCIDYLCAKREGRAERAALLWRRLGNVNGTRKASGVERLEQRLTRLLAASRRLVNAAATPEKVRRHLRALSARLDLPHRTSSRWAVAAGGAIESVALSVSRALGWTREASFRAMGRRWDPTGAEISRLVSRFAEAFPERADKLCADDARPYAFLLDRWRRLFSHYDVVQAYAVDPIYVLLAGHHPYCSYEHGTLRDFTMGDDPLHRLTALGYRESDHVFITNGDCLEYARRLGIDKLSPMIHPIVADEPGEAERARVRELRAQYRADLLLLCPLRHDWATKGADVHLRALARLKERVSGRIVLLLTDWGRETERSLSLLAECGCSDLVRWLRPLNRAALIRHMRAADVVLDQMALPHFGATAPQALAVGTPVVMSYRPESTAWIVDEPAPILSAFTPEEVVSAIVLATNPQWRSEFASRASAWVASQHHPRRLVRDHLRAYLQLASRREATRPADEECP